MRTNALKLYGLTPEKYDSMLSAQDGHCALCPATVGSRRNKHLHVDHDHDIDKVRGLLCDRCNRHRVGSNSLESARAVVAYLEKA